MKHRPTLLMLVVLTESPVANQIHTAGLLEIFFFFQNFASEFMRDVFL